MTPTTWRTVVRGWTESTPYARPGTWAIVDTHTHVNVRTGGFEGRFVVGAWIRSASILAGAIPLGGAGLDLVLLAGADTPRWAKSIVREYENDLETLAQDLWESLPDEYLAVVPTLTQENVLDRLGLTDGTDE